MRAARSVLSPILARLRWAMAWACAMSVLAALAAPALPLLLMHVVDLVQRHAPLDAVVLIAVVAALAVAARAALDAARDAILLRTAFWLDHSAGRVLLTDGVQQASPVRRFDADRLALTHVVGALRGPAVRTMLDSLAVVPLVVFLVLVHPAIGFTAIAAVAAFAGIGYRAAHAGGGRELAFAIRRADADAQWRSVGSSAPMLLMRGHTADAVAAWATADRAAVAVGYQLANRKGRAARLCDMAGATFIMTTLGVAVWLVLTDAMTLAGLVASAVTVVAIQTTAARAVSVVADLTAAETCYAHLAASRERPLFAATPDGRQSNHPSPSAATSLSSAQSNDARMPSGVAHGTGGAA